MWKIVKIGLVALSCTLAATLAIAGPDAEIKAQLGKLLPGEKIDSVNKTPVSGLYEVVMGPQLVYVSGDGRYMIQGRMIDLDKREDLTEPRRASARKQAVDKVGEDNMVIFAPKKYDHTVTAFTDTACGYCRKLHREIDDYGKAGIRVRYVFYPRAGVDSKSFKEAVSVWCADDRQKAMTQAKAGKSIDSKSCQNPVRSHMELGELLGISGTPAIVLESGDLVPGYVPAKRLSALLEKAGS